MLVDGHGSTQQLTSSTGAINATLRYDAFGTLLTSPVSEVAVLFGGDAIYDPISGLYLHGDGVRPTLGFEFIQRDQSNSGSNGDPITLHKYLYADADSVNGSDPTGDYDENNTDAYGDDSDDEYSGYLGNLLGDIAEQQTSTYNLAYDIGNNASNAEIMADTLAATTQPSHPRQWGAGLFTHLEFELQV